MSGNKCINSFIFVPLSKRNLISPFLFSNHRDILSKFIPISSYISVTINNNVNWVLILSVLITVYAHWPLITVPGKVGKLLSVGTLSGQHSPSEPGDSSLIPGTRPSHRPLLSPRLRPGPGSRPPRLTDIGLIFGFTPGKGWVTFTAKSEISFMNGE